MNTQSKKVHIAVPEDYNPDTMVLRTLYPDTQPTAEQIAMLEEAANYPVVYDADSPELTPQMAAAFRKAARERDQRRNRSVNF